MGVLCGVTVDDKDYNGFALKEYEVPGAAEFNPHAFADGKLSLTQIEFFANTKDYRQHFPEFSRACQKVVEQARREIQQHYAAKDGRKEYREMRHDNFQDYLKDLQEVHKRAAGERRDLQSKFNRAQEEWDEAQKDKTLSEYGLTAAKMKWLESEKENKAAVADLQKRTKDDIAAIRGEFDEHIQDFYSANGDRMDDGTIRLLNSGLKLTDSEIDRLVGQNVSNPTMLRLIADYCETNKLDNKAARIYGTYARAAGSHERKTFDHVVEMIEKATGDDDVMANTWGIEKGYFERLSNEAIESMAGLSVNPGNAEQSEA